MIIGERPPALGFCRRSLAVGIQLIFYLSVSVADLYMTDTA
jgi:hypothetical protein